MISMFEISFANFPDILRRNWRKNFGRILASCLSTSTEQDTYFFGEGLLQSFVCVVVQVQDYAAAN